MSQGLPRVTVVTPSFNQAQFLEQTICSVLGQDYPDLEYMVIDGGSSDGSVNIIEKYRARLAYWVSEPDDGQAQAINRGWNRASGEYVAYLNSDDLLLPGSISAVTQSLGAHPNVDLVYGWASSIDENGNKTSDKLWRAPAFDLCELLQGDYIPQPTIFFRRSLLDRIGFLNESLHFSFDYEFLLRASVVTDFRLIPQYLAAVRSHSATKSSTGEEQFFEEEYEILKHMANPPNHEIMRTCARLGYVTRLIYAAGYASGFSQGGRTQAMRRITELSPQPSETDIVAAITRRLNQTRHVPNGAANTPPLSLLTTVNFDPSRSLDALVDARVITAETSMRVSKRLRRIASLREVQAHREHVCYSKVVRTLLVAGLHDANIMRMFRWWIYLLVPHRVDGLLKPIYYSLIRTSRRYFRSQPSRRG
jgi:glycosyltransferase involved in cell wall biosynthesis